MTIRVRKLEPGDDRTGFRSGNVDLDRFFARYAGQNQFRHHIGATYIALGEDPELILGYATVAPSELDLDALPPAQRKGLPKHPLPVLRLARLAVDERAQGRGIGTELLRAITELVEQLARSVGCWGLVVDAKPEAVRFYEKLGFVGLEHSGGGLGDRPEPTPMVLPLT
ncbi:MAG: GNAT family N-acetyltransferase [Myxococcaceae bacterium]|nr:GNAT family N-acetyltransferase [Myxococcaceae bacterium]